MMSEHQPGAAPGASTRAGTLTRVGALVVLLSLIASGALAWARRHRPPAAIEAFTPALLPSIRRAAAMVPGQLPTRIEAHVLSVFDMSTADAAEGAPDETVPAVRAAFEVVFPDSWMMVDAGILYDVDDAAARVAYDRLQEALLGARTIVFTHEHQDHVGGVVRSPRRAELERNSLFTRKQLDWLLRQGPTSLIRLVPEEAERFTAFEYRPIAPVAAGVVLIESPGHTDGSQMIYVRLDSGVEVVLAGDVSYLASALASGSQKPDNPYLDEDHAALAAEMQWLREVSAQGVHVLLSHDYGMLQEAIARGVVQPVEDAPRAPPN